MASGPYQIGSINQLVHVALAPEFPIRLDDLRTMWSEVQRACADRGLRHVLVEVETMEDLLAPTGAIEHGELVARCDQPPLRIALCLYDQADDTSMRDFVQCANQGPSSLQIFDELGPALRWLGA